MGTQQHRIELRQLTEAEGGGWLATFSDLPGCMSDGETPEEAIHNAREAEISWLAASKIWATMNVKSKKNCKHEYLQTDSVQKKKNCCYLGFIFKFGPRCHNDCE